MSNVRELVRLTEKVRGVIFKVGWGCSRCDWLYAPHELSGKTMQELMDNFERQRDREFASHICVNHKKEK